MAMILSDLDNISSIVTPQILPSTVPTLYETPSLPKLIAYPDLDYDNNIRDIMIRYYYDLLINHWTRENKSFIALLNFYRNKTYDAKKNTMDKDQIEKTVNDLIQKKVISDKLVGKTLVQYCDLTGEHWSYLSEYFNRHGIKKLIHHKLKKYIKKYFLEQKK